MDKLTDPIRAARTVLEQRARDVRLTLVPGLAGDLKVIADALGELERRIGGVAAFACVPALRVPSEYGHLHRAEVENIAGMCDHARARLALAGLLKRGEGG